MLQAKYNSNGNLFGESSSRRSSTWNSIQEVLEEIKDGFYMKIGEGNSRLWYYPWVTKEPLCNQVVFVDIHDTALKVKDIYMGGEWQLQSLYALLPNEIKDRILTLKPRLAEGVLDRWVWEQDS